MQQGVKQPLVAVASVLIPLIGSALKSTATSSAGEAEAMPGEAAVPCRKVVI